VDDKQLRRLLINAKRRRLRVMANPEKDPGARAEVESRARACRLAGVDISDLVAESVGQLEDGL
jgi:hypothetical protein